jgi:hypothetical protein
MKDIDCFCNSDKHLSGPHEFKVYPPLYFSGRTILCPECGDSHISRRIHETPFTLKDAEASLGKKVE